MTVHVANAVLVTFFQHLCLLQSFEAKPHSHPCGNTNMSWKYSSQLEIEPGVAPTILLQPVGGSPIWTALGFSYYISDYSQSIHHLDT